MKNFNLIAVLLSMLFFVPASVMASPDDFDGITVEAIELDDDSSDSVTHEVEVPHEEDLEDHQEGHHDSHDNDGEHENDEEHDEESEEGHEDDSEDDHEESHDDHAELSGDESVS